MFPTAHSTVYYNEEGEVLGWDNDSYYDEPEYNDNPYDGYEEDDWTVCDTCGHEYDCETETHTRHECDKIVKAHETDIEDKLREEYQSGY